MYQPELFALIPPLPPAVPVQHKPAKPSRRRHSVLRKVQAFAELMEAAAWFEARDADKDGFVSREEFIRVSVANPPMLKK
jgi:hypothetical protein